MLIRLCVILFTTMLLFGCASTGKMDVHPEIIITENDIPDKKYKVLDDISVTAGKTTIFHDDPTKENVNNLLKKKAAKLGADAVILVRYGTVGIGMSWGDLKGNGRAVKILD